MGKKKKKTTSENSNNLSKFAFLHNVIKQNAGNLIKYWCILRLNSLTYIYKVKYIFFLEKSIMMNSYLKSVPKPVKTACLNKGKTNKGYFFFLLV